jgi:phosphoribulokinase
MAIEKLSALVTGIGTTAETQNGASTTTSEIDDKNQIKKQFMSSQAFHRITGRRIQKITAEERFKSRTLESFEPVTQEWTSFILH